MSYQTTQVFRTHSYDIRDNNNPEWYFKIISLREEIAKIEDEIAVCNEENSIQLLREKIGEILLEIENLEEGDDDDGEDDKPEEEI
jgi:hypothetical protein